MRESFDDLACCISPSIVPLYVYVPVVLLNVIWVMSVSMLASLVSQLFVVARQGFF